MGMKSRWLLGVDIGTYSSKGVLVRDTGEVVASSVAEHSLRMPKPGHFEHDPEETWWRDFRAICGELLRGSGIDPRTIAGIGISTISPAVVPVDEAGLALRPAILYGIDTRATREIAELERSTGGHFDSQSAAPKIMWIRRNEPEVWARTRGVVNGSGYLVRRLTGEATIDVYDATIFAPLFDERRLRWSEEAASLVAPTSMMPRPTWTCDIAGHVTAKAARETGLAEGTPVITGTADAAAEAVSAGLAEPGDLMVMYGSSTFFILKTPEPRTPKGFWGSRFLEKDSYVVAGGTATAGSLTRWFRDSFAPAEIEAEKRGGPNAYAALADLAEASPAGARGLVALPYFSGERTPLHDPDAKGVIFGLTLSHTRADIYRALLESVGYAIRHNLEALAAEGCAAKRILAVGGGTRNLAWMRMVSDIAGITQAIPEQQIGASYGDAFLAGVGVGMFPGPSDISRWVRARQVLHPDEKAHALYGDYYRVYRELYERTAGAMHALGGIARRDAVPSAR
jgi:xylulokinase